MSSGIFSGGKLYFRFLMFQNGLKNQYLGFQRISRKSVKAKFLTYHVTRSHIEVELAFFETCSDSFNMGRVCLALMSVVTLQCFKNQDDWQSESRSNVQF